MHGDRRRRVGRAEVRESFLIGHTLGITERDADGPVSPLRLWTLFFGMRIDCCTRKHCNDHYKDRNPSVQVLSSPANA